MVIDRETGLPPLSAAERMRQYDAQSGNGPTRFASIDRAEAAESVSRAKAEPLNPFAAAQLPAAPSSDRSRQTAPAQRQAASKDSKSVPAGASLHLTQKEWTALLMMVGGTLFFFTILLGPEAFVFLIFAIGFSLFQGWPQRIARKWVQLSDQQKRG